MAKSVKSILKQINKHQKEVKRLVYEVEDMHPGLDDFMVEGETWGMIIDRQGDYWEPEASKVLLERYLNEMRREKLTHSGEAKE